MRPVQLNPAAPLSLSAQQKAVLVGWFWDGTINELDPTYVHLERADQHLCQVAWDLLQLRYQGERPNELLVAPLRAAWNLNQLQSTLNQTPAVLWLVWFRRYCVEALFLPWVERCIRLNAHSLPAGQRPTSTDIDTVCLALQANWATEDVGVGTNMYSLLDANGFGWMWNAGRGGLTDLQWFNCLLWWMHQPVNFVRPRVITQWVALVFRSKSGIPWKAGGLFSYAEEACTNELLLICPKAGA